MLKIAIIADDLTGANATGCLLTKQGFSAITFLNLDTFNENADQSVDVVSINTASRGMTERQAYEIVQKVLNKLPNEEGMLYSKRIDSTLRGNVGIEIKSMLDYLSNHVAIVVPSFPASGRKCIEGYLYINQILLENTDAAKDPKRPVIHSNVETIIHEQYHGSIASIYLDEVLKGDDYIKYHILKASTEGYRVIVIDAATDEDILNIAKAVKDCAIPVISVDPGPFTAALSKEILRQPGSKSRKKILLSIGSVSELTRKQIKNLKIKYKSLFYYVDAKNLLNTELLYEECMKATQFFERGIADYDILGITANHIEEDILNLKMEADKLGITEEEVSNLIADGLAKITLKVLEDNTNYIRGLYTSGGDITIAVCKELKASGIVIMDEVLPLAVYGTIFKGEYHGYPIITKGGLVGDDNALICCVEYLLNKVEQVIT